MLGSIDLSCGGSLGSRSSGKSAGIPSQGLLLSCGSLLLRPCRVQGMQGKCAPLADDEAGALQPVMHPRHATGPSVWEEGGPAAVKPASGLGIPGPAQ